jgi:hypothetical protein
MSGKEKEIIKDIKSIAQKLGKAPGDKYGRNEYLTKGKQRDPG